MEILLITLFVSGIVLFHKHRPQNYLKKKLDSFEDKSPCVLSPIEESCTLNTIPTVSLENINNSIQTKDFFKHKILNDVYLQHYAKLFNEEINIKFQKYTVIEPKDLEQTLSLWKFIAEILSAGEFSETSFPLETRKAWLEQALNESLNFNCTNNESKHINNLVKKSINLFLNEYIYTNILRSEIDDICIKSIYYRIELFNPISLKKIIKNLDSFIENEYYRAPKHSFLKNVILTDERLFLNEFLKGCKEDDNIPAQPPGMGYINKQLLLKINQETLFSSLRFYCKNFYDPREYKYDPREYKTWYKDYTIHMHKERVERTIFQSIEKYEHSIFSKNFAELDIEKQKRFNIFYQQLISKFKSELPSNTSLNVNEVSSRFNIETRLWFKKQKPIESFPLSDSQLDEQIKLELPIQNLITEIITTWTN